MGINFPASPTLNQKYPQPAVAGVPVYTWDGEKWTTVGGSIAAYAPPADAVPLMNAGTGLVGTSTDYAREDHVHPTDASLLAYSGMQINGGMEVSQERGFGSGVTTTNYICDGWYLYRNGTMGVTSAPAKGSSVAGLTYLLYIATTTAQPSLGAGDAVLLLQRIEGYRIERLAWGTAAAQPITIGFWATHQRVGTYSVAIHNGVADRSYVTTYTQNVSGVNEYKTVTIPGDTAGSWVTENENGMVLIFAMASGSTGTTATTNAWIVGDFTAASGQVNGVTTTSDAFRITGVTVLPGTQAPTAAQSPNIMRPYGEELATCQRYYQKIGGGVGASIYLNGFQTAGQGLGFSLPYNTVMRAAPTALYIGNWNFVNVQSGSVTLFIGIDTIGIFFAATAQGTVAMHTLDATGFIQLDARL